jgi:plastocyanin
MKHLSTGLLALVGTFAVAAVVATGPTAGRADPAQPVPATTAVASPAASGLVVDTKNFAYAPATLNVNAGDTVTFKNSDTIAHTVTAADKSFDSGNMDQGATWSHVFKTAGTYAYVCAYHSYMTGTIVVK